ncbi:MAG: hypothetical protein R2828_06470 [Saprospiraceae bacterium]
MKKTCLSFSLFVAFILLLIACNKDKENKPQVITAAGQIQAAMDEFRNLLGANNGNAASSQPAGRREINWDALPDDIAVPNNYIGDFFNDPANGATRGIEFTTPGTGLIVSADKSNPTNTLSSFGNINPTYTNIFPPFSGERIFSPLGSNIADIRFYVPGTNTPANVKGFGAVYIDVDTKENDAFEFFDINGKSLGTYSTPVMNEGYVFLAVLFDLPVIHHVRITYGNSPLGPNDEGYIDVSVMDDFIFGEPQPAQ